MLSILSEKKQPKKNFWKSFALQKLA